MFSKIRNRLTVFYTGMMILFLLSFLATTFVSLTWVLFIQQKQEVILFAEEEAHEHIDILRQAQTPDFHPTPDEEGGSTLFFYAYDTLGRRVHAYEPPTALQDPILNIIGRWDIAPNEVKFETIKQSDNQTHYILITSRLVQTESESLGVVYVGKDITSYYEVLKTVLAVTLAICFAFLIAASWFGHAMASRAMKAAAIAFDRQREFVADASHELRTPLSVMLASVETIQGQEQEDARLTPFSQQVLADMKDEILRMTKIVSGLLTLARGDAGETRLEKENLSINSLVQQTLRTFRPLADKKDIALTQVTMPDTTLYADRQRIEQLLMILLDNAIKNTPSGGRVAVHISHKDRHKVQISVNDTGSGIAEEDQLRIFERFYRVDKARSRESGGTGLGLPIAKWIVDSHGGTIAVKSTLGNGSQFIVTLPC